MGFLEDVIARKRLEIESRQRVLPAGALPPHPSLERHAFLESLTREGIRVICEVKRRSPTKPDLAPNDDLAARVHAYREGGAAAISILTDEQDFGGSLVDLETARAEVSIPLLRKDFLIDPYQILEAANAGASAVLLIVAALDGSQLEDMIAFTRAQSMEPLVEVHEEAELERALEAKARVIGVNNRNLSTLEIDLGTSRRLIQEVPEGIVAVAESGIREASEVHNLAKAGYRAFLIGTSLMQSEDIVGDLREFQGFIF
jgi:indole-3-glycerol phosphate synthase